MTHNLLSTCHLRLNGIDSLIDLNWLGYKANFLHKLANLLRYLLKNLLSEITTSHAFIKLNKLHYIT